MDHQSDVETSASQEVTSGAAQPGGRKRRAKAEKASRKSAKSAKPAKSAKSAKPAKPAKPDAAREAKGAVKPDKASKPKKARRSTALDLAHAAAQGVRAAAAAAGDVLGDVAALVRHSGAPAADRIARAVAGRPTLEARPGAAAPGEPSPDPVGEHPPELLVDEGTAASPAPMPLDDAPAQASPIAVDPPDRDSSIVPIQGVTVGASVDIGANSVHLLVAAVGGHRLQPLVDESVFLGLGDRIDHHGFLDAAARGELVAALVGYADAARRLGATEITFVGTEPMRRAADAATVVQDVQRHAGVALHVLRHDEEGFLTLIGVTAGQPVTHELVVVDVGGGSSEIVIVGPGRAPVAAGLTLGSARLTQRFVRADPPSEAEIDALAAEARRAVADAPQAAPEELVAVGGTVSNLLKVIPAAALERVLTRRRITAALAMLATEPSAQASLRHAVNPTRARILPAGAVIVDALLEHYGLEQLRVSEDGIREGAILVAAHAGRAWRDRLPELALGWRELRENGRG